VAQTHDLTKAVQLADKLALDAEVKGACPHDCPDTCALVSTVASGRVIKVSGAKDHPSTAGVLCTKVSRYAERTYSSDKANHTNEANWSKGFGSLCTYGLG
jgi:anaerobic selenocysteine-containing dehydrogenase